MKNGRNRKERWNENEKRTSELHLFFSQPPQEFIYYRWRRINLKSSKFVNSLLGIIYYLLFSKNELSMLIYLINILS